MLSENLTAKFLVNSFRKNEKKNVDSTIESAESFVGTKTNISHPSSLTFLFVLGISFHIYQ